MLQEWILILFISYGISSSHILLLEKWIVTWVISVKKIIIFTIIKIFLSSIMCCVDSLDDIARARATYSFAS